MEIIYVFLLTVNDVDVNNYDYATVLYEKYGKAMWKYAYILSKNYDIANDVFSTTFLKIIEKIEIIKKIHTYKIKSYLMCMVMNCFFIRI